MPCLTLLAHEARRFVTTVDSHLPVVGYLEPVAMDISNCVAVVSGTERQPLRR